MLGILYSRQDEFEYFREVLTKIVHPAEVIYQDLILLANYETTEGILKLENQIKLVPDRAQDFFDFLNNTRDCWNTFPFVTLTLESITANY